MQTARALRLWCATVRARPPAGGSAYTIHSNEYDTFTGTQPLEADSQPLNYEQDDFEAWSSDRDTRYRRSPSARYVSPDVIGYEDLDNQGDWGDDPEYGHVWYPNGVEVGWAPYHFGHWAYIAPWGYTWVDDRPWGFAPFPLRPLGVVARPLGMGYRRHRASRVWPMFGRCMPRP